jgi:ABC-2 type transport system ATP-binding protein
VGLDPRQIIEVRNLIKNLAGQTTVVLSTHILPEVSMTCDRVAIINKGCVVSSGNPDELMLQLSGGMRYELEVEGDRSYIAEQLQRVTDITELQWLSPEGLPELRHRLRVSTETNADFGKQLAAVLVSEQVGLYEMRKVGASLEDVFLQLTTEEKAVDAPATVATSTPELNDNASEQTEETE